MVTIEQIKSKFDENLLANIQASFDDMDRLVLYPIIELISVG